MPVFGGRKVRRTLRRMLTETNVLLNATLDNQARELQGAAIAVAPELSRKMILSSKITKRVHAGSTSRVVSFDTPYAELQHENTSLRPGPLTRAKAATQDGVAGPKYLERPYDRLLPKFIKQMRRVMLLAAKRAKR